MNMETERLIMRPWLDSDAEELYKYAKDPDVGYPAGWPAHKSPEDSRRIIKEILSASETYAIVLKETGLPIGSIGLMPGGVTDLTDEKDEYELGYWIGKPYWGRGLTPEAAREMIRHAFEDLKCKKVWCGYYDGNVKSKRVQEKCGFKYVKTTENIYVKQIGETRTGHVNCLTKEDWLKNAFGVVIRAERPDEYRAVENLVREAFWNVYRPGCLEHFVLKKLRNDPAFVKELDFVMEKDGALIGQNMFMRAVIKSDDGRDIPIMTMGPICIAPEYKRKGYGKILLDYTLEKAAALGCPALCFEGNIDFYGKCGFTFASRYGIRYHDLPEGADASFFLCKELIPGYLDGITGEYAPPEGYFVCDKYPDEFDAYEATFPPKEKKILPGQLAK